MFDKSEYHSNNIPDSKIAGVEICLSTDKNVNPRPYIRIYYKATDDDLSVADKVLKKLGLLSATTSDTLLYGEKLALFQNKCSEKNPDAYHKISPKLLKCITDNYSSCLQYFKDSKLKGDHISQSEINDFYNWSEKLLQHHQRIAATKGKPLLLLIGENHYGPSCRLAEQVFFSIAKDMGMKTMAFEQAAEFFDVMKKYTPKQTELTSVNMIALFKIAEASPAMQFYPLEDKTRRKAYEIATKLNYNAIGMAIRDRAMASKIAELIPKKGESLMAVVGADHLKGLLKQTPKLSDLYEVCIFDLNEFQFYYNTLLSDPPQGIPLEKTPIFYSNTEMYQRVLQAREKNLQKQSSSEDVPIDSKSILPEKISELTPSSSYAKMISNPLKPTDDGELKEKKSVTDGALLPTPEQIITPSPIILEVPQITPLTLPMSESDVSGLASTILPQSTPTIG